MGKYPVNWKLDCLYESIESPKLVSDEQEIDNKIDDFSKRYLTNLSVSNLTNAIKSSSQIITNIDDITNSTPIQYKKFLSQCEEHPHVAIIGKNFPSKIKDKISEHFWELPDLSYSEKNNFFMLFNSVDEFNDYVSSEKYGSDENNYPKICRSAYRDHDNPGCRGRDLGFRLAIVPI